MRFLAQVRLGLLFSALLGILLLFQNCQKAKMETGGAPAQTLQNNAYVYEGKVFVLDKDAVCADGKSSRAQIRYLDANRAEKIRDNCADLNPVQALNAQQFSLDPANVDQLIHQGDLFVAVSPEVNKIARVQAAEAVFVTGSLNSISTAPFPAPIAQGGFIVCAVIYYSPSIPDPVTQVSDTAGNSFVRAGAQTIGPAGYKSEVWFRENATGGVANNRVTVSAPNVGLNALHCFEYRGIARSGAFRQSVENTGTGSGTYSVTVGSVNSAGNELMFLSIFSSNNIPAVAPGFEMASTFGNDSLQQKIVTVPGPYTVTSQVTDTWLANLVTFRAQP